MRRLTAMSVKAAKIPGRYGDGSGLFLQVAKSGSASWIVRVQKAGRRRDIGLGSAKKVSLADAREKAVVVRSQIEAGLDPVVERKKKEGIPTFFTAAALVFEANKQSWKNGKHEWQWMRTLEMFVFPDLGDCKVSDISAMQIRDVLAKIWMEKPETARRVRQRIGAILDYAHARGWRDTEAPMRSISKGLPRQPTRKGRFAAMPYADVPAFLIELRTRESLSRLALEALILCTARSGEIRGARWDELDFGSGIWTVPADRMKAGNAHAVPLSRSALGVFRRARELRIGGNSLIFPGMKRGKPFSDMTLLKILRDMGLAYTVHGFRSSFRDWAADCTEFPGEIAEAALAHSNPNRVEAAYRRTDFFAKRSELICNWADFCEGNEKASKSGTL